MNLSFLADVVWPSLILELRLLSPIPIGCGLIVEWVLLHLAFDLTWKKAAWVDIVMNAASTVAGSFLIPQAGLILHQRFSALDFLLSYLIAVLTSTAIEAAVVKWLFKIPLNRRRLWILCGANGLSTGIALVSLIIFPLSSHWFPTLPLIRLWPLL